MSTFRLNLSLPFDINLVYYWPFQTKEAAEAFSERLPHGFVPVEDDDVNPDAIVVPFKKDKTVKPEEIKRYEEAAVSPIAVGDIVYLVAYRKRGRVTHLEADGTMRVSADGQVFTFKTSDVRKVPGNIDLS